MRQARRSGRMSVVAALTLAGAPAAIVARLGDDEIASLAYDFATERKP